MTVVATIAIDEDTFVLGQVFAGTTACIELAEFVPIGNGLVPYFWVTDEHDPATFEASVREESPIAELTRLDESDG